MANDGQALMIFIDNSETSINGDFYPNRLEAQKIAAERLIQFFFRKSPNTQIGVGMLAEGTFGIAATLTNNSTKLEESIDNIKRGGILHLVHGIRCGFLALHHCDPEVRQKRIIVFVGSQHDITDEKTASQLAQYANKEAVAIDIVAFGDEVNCKNILEDFVSKLTEKSHYVVATSTSIILSDLVLSSPIGPGDSQNDSLFEDDPDLLLTIQLSLQQDGNPNDASGNQMQEDLDLESDPELALAIQLSKQEMEEREKKEKDDDKKDNK